MRSHQLATEALLTVTVMVLLAVALDHVYLLDAGVITDQLFTFWVPIVIAGLIVFYASWYFKSKFPLLLTVIFTIGFHLIPFVGIPSGMTWSYNGIYGLQLVTHAQLTNHWTFGYGTVGSGAYQYSFYPLVFIFGSIFSNVSTISSVNIVNYAMPFLSVLVLFAFYLLINGLFNFEQRIKNLMLLFFAFSPYFPALTAIFCMNHLQ